MIKESLCQRVWSSIRRLWPKMDPNLKGATQKVPFDVNRFVLLVICIIYTSTSACVYFNWNSMREILYDAGIYAELNSGDAVDKTQSKQYLTINSLFPTTLAIHFTTSVFCGFLYDHIGPKLTAALGQFFNIMCWLFLSLRSTSFNSTLIGFVFMGLGADTAFIPVLTIANLFPDASTFILTLIGAAASLSFAVPVALNGVMKIIPGINFTWVCYLYICVILAPCFIVAILLFPLRPFKGVDDYEREKEKENLENVEDAYNYNDSVKKDLYGTYKQSNNESITQTSEDVSKGGHGNTTEQLVKMEEEDVLHMSHKRASIPSLSMKRKNELHSVVDEEQPDVNDKNYIHKDKESVVNLREIHEKDIDEHFHWASIRLFLKLLITFPSVCVIVYFIIFNISMVFYGMINETYFEYDTSVITIINILFPLSCIPCIIFGRIVNRFGAAIVIIMMNACSALMHLTALLKYKVFGVLSAIFYMFATSMYTSQIYCFIQNAFPTIVFGKFIGFASLCGGLFSLFAEPIYRRILRDSYGKKVDPTSTSCALIAAFAVLFIPLTILKIKNYECVSELVNTKSFRKSSSTKSRKEDESSKI